MPAAGSPTAPPPSQREEISLSEPDIKRHDFATRSEPATRATSQNPSPTADMGDTDGGSSSATNSSDEFDWEEEDDPDNPERVLEKTKAKRGRALWLGFMRLARPIRVILVMLIGCGLLIAPLLVFELRFRNSAARPHVFAWSLWLSICWAAACITYLVVDAIPRIVIRIIVLYGGNVENMKTQIELIMAVSAWLKLALDISFAWIAISVIRGIYHPPGSYWKIVNRVMQAIFSAGMLLLVEKLFLRLVAITFHRKALAERLAENRLGLKALDRLSNAQPVSRKKPHAPYANKGHKSNRSSVAALDLFTLGKRDGQGSSSSSSPVHEKGSPPPTNRKGAARTSSDRAAGRARRKKALAAIIVDQVQGAIGQVALKNSEFNRKADYGSLYSARKLARKLFNALSDVMPPRSHLIEEDFNPYFNTTAEAHAAFAIFDKDGNGDISKKEMREAVQRIYRERKALIASLKDVSSAVAKLDACLLFGVLVVLIFICLLIFNPSDTLSSLVPMATIVIGFSFMFGHSAQMLFESLIFIFSTHVFDVGDLVLIDDSPLFVREFGLFSTTFRRVDGMEVIAPNALLSSAKLVHNLRRSASMYETTNLMISYSTSMEVVEQLRQRMKAYVAQNNREWSSCDVYIDKMEFQNSITLIVSMEHRPNWQDWGGRWVRRNAFMKHLKTTLEELDLRYTLPVQPVLLPRDTPFASTRGLGPAPRGYSAASDDLGNAGRFQGSADLRVPGQTIRSDANAF